MFKIQQVTGPVAPGQYSPLQVSGPSAYYPMLTTDQLTAMFSMMMPMIMFIVMFAIIAPILKGVVRE